MRSRWGREGRRKKMGWGGVGSMKCRIGLTYDILMGQGVETEKRKNGGWGQ